MNQKISRDHLRASREGLTERDPGPHADKAGALYIGDSNIFLAEQIKSAKMGLCDALTGLATEIQESREKIITSNESLSESNAQYACALNWLTAGLVLVGILNVIVALKF